MADTPAGSGLTWAETIRKLKVTIDQWLQAALIFGLLVSALFGLASGARADMAPALAHIVGMLIAVAIVGGAVALGAIAGFLFGLPRTLTSGDARELARLNAGGASRGDRDSGEDGAEPTATGDRVSVNAATAAGGFGANTNLERISDWLTTIIIGIGLANLTSLPGAVERFGERADRYFTFGGHAFAIGAGIYFLIFGFLLSYISTRTKLLIIFTENERDKRTIESGALSVAVTKSAGGDSLPSFQRPEMAAAASDMPGAAAAEVRRSEITPVSKADRIVLEKVPFQPNQTPEEMLAVAKASARAGDFAKALLMYREYMRIAPFDPQIATDYARVLGMNGDTGGLEALREEFHARNADPQIAAAEEGFNMGLRAALQANLYNGRYEDAIRLGELLVRRLGPAKDAWAHLWLACAYGQRHRAIEQRGGAGEEEARNKAVAHAEEAIIQDRHMASYVRTLYVPGEALGEDADLNSLYPYQALHGILDIERAGTR